jgi:hypothetical protein
MPSEDCEKDYKPYLFLWHVRVSPIGQVWLHAVDDDTLGPASQASQLYIGRKCMTTRLYFFASV